MLPKPLQFNSCRILVIGDVMVDKYIWGDVERISPEAPVPVFHIKRNSVVAGGAGNVLSNLVGLGCRVSIIGLIGQDESGQQLQRIFEHENIENLNMVVPSHTTITKTRVVAHGQQLIRIDDENIVPLEKTHSRDIIELIKTRLSGIDAIILSDYGKGMFLSFDFANDLISMARNAGIPVFIDPKGKDWSKYRGATCITPNTKELELVHGSAISDDENLILAMNEVIERYNLSFLLVTRGPKGMCLLPRGESPEFIESQALDVWDVSGAGDTVISTLAAGVANGMQFLDATRLANRAAGIVVSKVGTHPISKAELEQSIRMSNGFDDGSQTNKLITKESARIQIDAWKSIGEKIIFTNGCFDLLHPGHVYLLNKAKKLGHRLIIGINSDESVNRLKGPERPVLNEQDRAAILCALNSVDLVIIFPEDTPENLISFLKPDILVKGKDYKIEEVVGKDIVESFGGQVQLVEVLKGYSTTKISNKIKSNHIKVA